MPEPGGRIIYIVDEDAAVREGLARLMDSAWLQARPCATLPEFLQQARGTRVACVLLDVAGLRTCEPSLQSALQTVAKVLPVIALSSGDEPSARQAARSLGARAFFQKPVDGAALIDSIEWLMHGEARGAED